MKRVFDNLGGTRFKYWTDFCRCFILQTATEMRWLPALFDLLYPLLILVGLYSYE